MPEPATKPVALRAGRSPRAIAWFIGLALFSLGADLWLKAYAFANVAREPLLLSRDPDDGTTLVQVQRESGQLITLPRAHPKEPASAIPPHEGIVVVPGVLTLKLTINTGAVFGLGKGAQWLFVIVSIAATAFILIVFYRSRPDARLLHICLSLILGGALGNLYDRVMYNGVRVMCLLFPEVHLPLGWTRPGGASEIYPWIFNIADAALVIGVILLLIVSWKSDKQPEPAGQSAPG